LRLRITTRPDPGGFFHGKMEKIMSTMRAKMKVSKVEQYEGGEILHFTAVGSNNYPEDGVSEDNTFAKYTPCGEMKLTVSNPALHGKIKPGEKYYLDFTKAE
jgi:hypothetical protein